MCKLTATEIEKAQQAVEWPDPEAVKTMEDAVLEPLRRFFESLEQAE